MAAGEAPEMMTKCVPTGSAPALAAAVTGQTVVEMGTTEVVTTVEWAGQLLTDGPQLVTVTSWLE